MSFAAGDRGRPLSRARRRFVLATRWQGGHVATEAYRSRLEQVARAGSTLLHGGCGWDKLEMGSRFADSCRVIGVDLDPAVARRARRYPFCLASLEMLPFPERSFDIIFSEYVLEHVEDTDRCFAEMSRTLKPGGSVVMLTPSLLSYKSLAAALTPQWFHVWMGRLRYGRGHEADMYRTRYHCNTGRAIRDHAGRHGLTVVSIETLNNGPTWFVRFPIVFGIFDAIHRLMEHVPVLRRFRCALLVQLAR